MKKRILSIIMVLTMVTALFGCGGGQGASGKKESKISEIDFNETGYPIVNEPITLKVGVMADSSYQAAWDDLEWVKQVEEASGINLEFVVYNDDRAVALAFASQEFPDISWGVGDSQQLYDAAQGGFVYALDEYMDEYAPNWANYFKENEESLKKIQFDDGHFYSFPMIREETYHYQVRDLWQINKTWLDELGLKVPTTTDEFYNALKAFKDNAGKGSIPSNVIPYYVNGLTATVGGALDLINSYGVYVSTENYDVTVDDDGKVVYNFANPELKEPLKFIHKLVNEGLIAKSSLTAGWNTYLAKTMSEVKTIGCYSAYYNYTTDKDEYVNIGPLDSGNGKTPLMRSQANALQNGYFTVYSECEYPELAVRLANMLAEPEWTIQGTYGMLNNPNSTLYKDAEGNYVTRGGLNGYDLNVEVPSFRFACLMSEELFSTLKFEETSNRYQRHEAVETTYAGKTMKQENLYPFFNFSEENYTELNDLYLDIHEYMTQTLTSWIVNGGIDEGWDGYVKQLENLGLSRYLELLQEELDTFNGK